MSFKAFLKIESADPKRFQGESQDKDHRNWIDILSFSMSINARVDPDNGMVTKSKSRMQEIKFQKTPDRSSSDLIQAVASNTELKRVLLHFVSIREGRVTYDVRWEFHDAKVVSFRTVAWRGDGAEGSSSAKHASQFDAPDIQSFTIAYKSVRHQVGSSLPGSSKSDSWSSAPAGAVSAGATALATHMLRLHQVG